MADQMPQESVHSAAMQLQQAQLQQAQLQQHHLQQLHVFWQTQHREIEELDSVKQHELPLARIKKIMKSDEEVRQQMISAEAPVLFAKACEMFILELTLRAWIHTEDNKRRTLQRNDIAMAITKTDSFDFLIDIVPRDDAKPMKKVGPMGDDLGERGVPMGQEQLQYYYQLAQQQQALLNPAGAGGAAGGAGGAGGGAVAAGAGGAGDAQFQQQLRAMQNVDPLMIYQAQAQQQNFRLLQQQVQMMGMQGMAMPPGAQMGGPEGAGGDASQQSQSAQGGEQYQQQ